VRSAREVWAFLTPWDATSVDSFRHHASQITVLVASDLALRANGTFTSEIPPGVERLAHGRGVKVEPLLTNDVGGWKPRMADRVLRSPGLRRTLVDNLARAANAKGWDGINVDLENLPARSRRPFVAFVAELGRALGHKRTVSVDVPADPAPAYDLGALGRVAKILVMAYDQHATAASVGPIASPAWVGARAATARMRAGTGNVIVGLPTYGYEWVRAARPIAIDASAALTLAGRLGVRPVWSRSGGEPWFSTGGRSVWFSDAVALARDLRALPAGQPVALWHLGGEDQGIWPVLAGQANASALTAVPPPRDVALSGTGDIVRAIAARAGRRTVSPSLSSEVYRSVPKPWRLVRSSGGGRRVAITFDDGPDPRWTPAIMAELTRLHVPATFFLIGQNAASYPGLVSGEISAGFTVGDHTFTHPNLAVISDLRARLEIAATARTLTGITGRRPMLFRQPYAADTSPGTPGPVRPLLVAQSLGQTAVGASIDSQDYLRQGVRRIVHNVLAGLPNGNIILFHDGGGDRAQTVAALPLVVAALRQRGYSLVSVPQLLGKTPDQVMPREHGWALWTSRLVAWTFIAWFSMVRWVGTIGILIMALLAFRAVAMGTLAVRHRRRGRTPRPGTAPDITVLVPAYNEASVIGSTLDSLLVQEGCDAEIIVIDDGSTDGTVAAAARAGVRVIQQANTGKWAALNRGLAAARGEVVIAIDADTVLDRHAVARLARWFTEPDVGAVSGTAKVGNRHTLVALWQHIEYITSFNLDRRAYADMNAITVVPGAIGAWRRSALLQVGGYSGRTLAEDCDLTVALRLAGWRIAYEPDAVAWTEAPETLRTLARQRFRWTFGTLQVLWLNRGALFRRRSGALGAVALPYAWLYQLVLSPIAPAVDLIVLLALVSGGWPVALTWFAIATIAEMTVAFVAFRLEGERAWPVLTLPLQRFVYRQLMYWIVLRALGRATRGGRVGWAKLTRTGSVTLGSTVTGAEQGLPSAIADPPGAR
jgi:cellulose synthase/poly-beta-1,6-N-acetylglucosamine synthase-like glycosyltransferase/peptidoglycan/xylan/chitin deacetylase (PgdA/CDA1 family)